MLAADKDRLVYEIKQKALSLRKQELEMIVSRYNNLAALCSIMAGFSFDAIVELEFPEMYEDGTLPDNHILHALKPVFYLSCSLSLALSLYVVAVASFTVVYGHQLALLGSHARSLDKAVAVMLKQHNPLFVTSSSAMICVIIAATSIAWIKMDPPFAMVSTMVFVVMLAATARALHRLRSQLNRSYYLIHGDMRVLGNGGTGQVDLTRLDAAGGEVQLRRDTTYGNSNDRRSIRATLRSWMPWLWTAGSADRGGGWPATSVPKAPPLPPTPCDKRMWTLDPHTGRPMYSPAASAPAASAAALKLTLVVGGPATQPSHPVSPPRTAKSKSVVFTHQPV